MTSRSELLEKESTVFAATENPGVRPSRSSPDQTAVINAKQLETDELLENTLFNIIKRNKLLTKRETEILRLIVSGNTNKKIAQKIHRTERTVEYHRHRLMHKLGVNTAADLVKCAIVMGLV